MSIDIASLVVGNFDLWTAAIERKSGAGRGGSKKINLHGIERLRTLILDLAVRGRLVPQDAADEPAATALGRISHAQKAKIEAGLARKPRTIAPLSKELPALPPGWVWTQLGTLAEIGPTNKVEDDVEAAFVPMTLVSTNIAGEHQAETRRWGDVKKGFTQFAEGDIGLAKITPCFENGKAAIFQNLPNGVGAGTTELHVARPWSEYVNRRYILITMKTASYLAKGEEQMTGTAGQKRVTRTYFEANPLPFPPLAEQLRIVSKVDELMALCDLLETKSASALGAHQTLVETLLALLVDAADAGDLVNQWARLEAHFDVLFTSETSIDTLKQTILDLAVRGQLVEQDAKDEPASQLLLVPSVSRNINRPSRLRSKATTVNLPAGWELVLFGDYAIDISTGPFGTMVHKEDYVEGGVPLINPSHMIDDKISEDPSVSLRPKKADELSSYRLKAGDLIFARRGEVGRLAQVTEREEGWLCGTGSFRASFGSRSVQPYLVKFFRSRLARNYLGGESVGATMSNLNQSILMQLPVLVPPLAEQRRIVAKIDELFTLCDALKSRLAEAEQTRLDLADAIVERAAA